MTKWFVQELTPSWKQSTNTTQKPENGGEWYQGKWKKMIVNSWTRCSLSDIGYD